MSDDKPTKIVYENQEEIRAMILEELLRILPDCEVYLHGSVVKGQFGVYSEPYKGKLRSDIDLVIIPSRPLPESWKCINPPDWHREWCDLYKLGTINIYGLEHRIEAMVTRPGMREEAIMRIRERFGVIEKIK